MKLSVLKGATSVLVRVFIRDSSSTTGGGLTGLVFNTAGLVCYRMRDDDGNAGATAITLATATKGTWASGGFVEKDATNAPGWYEFGIPNNALAAGSRGVSFHLKGATNMAPTPFEIELTGWDNQDTVRGGITSLPNVAQAATGTQTNGALLRWGDVLPAAPAANTIDECLFLTDILGGRFGTAQAGAAGTITLDAGASSTDGRYVGYGVYLYGGTGGGLRGTGQERTIVAYNGTTKVATVAQAWGTNPDNTSKFMLVVQPFTNVGVWNGTAVSTPATAGVPDVNAKNINNVATTSVTTVNANVGTTQPTNYTGAGAGALVKGDTVDWAGTAVSVPTTAGVPNVNVKTWNDLTTVALPLAPTTAGRTLDVSAGGEAGLDWANVGSPTTTLALTGTTIATTQKVDVDTIKTNPVVNAGTITFPTTATLASTTNITAGTVTTLTNLPTIPNNWLTAAGLASDAAAEIASSVRTELNVELGRIDATVSSRLATAGYTAPDNATIAAIAGYVDTEVGAIKAVTDKLDSMLHLNDSTPGTAGDYQFTGEALENGPGGDTGASLAQIQTELDTRGLTLTVTGRIDVSSSTLATAATLATVDARLDTEIPAIQTAVVTTIPATLSNLPTAAQVADKLLGRNLAGGSDGGRTVQDALRAGRNKVAFDVPSAGQFTVMAEDDATPAWTGTYTRGSNTLGPLLTTDPA